MVSGNCRIETLESFCLDRMGQSYVSFGFMLASYTNSLRSIVFLSFAFLLSYVTTRSAEGDIHIWTTSLSRFVRNQSSSVHPPMFRANLYNGRRFRLITCSSSVFLGEFARSSRELALPPSPLRG